MTHVKQWGAISWLPYIYILALPSLNWPKLLNMTYHKGMSEKINNLNIKHFSQFHYLHFYVQKK